MLAAPGHYTVTLVQEVDGRATELAGPLAFEVAPMRKGTLPGATPADAAAFAARVAAVQRSTSAASEVLRRAVARVDDLRTALSRSRSAPETLDPEIHALRQELYAIEEALAGNRSKASIGEGGPATVGRRLQVAAQAAASTYGPTPTQRRALEIAEQEFAPLRDRIETLVQQKLPAFEKRVEAAGAPWTPGRALPPLP